MDKTTIQNHLIHKGWKYIDSDILSKGCCSRYRMFLTYTSAHYQKLDSGQWLTITQDNIENIEIIDDKLKIGDMIL
jgi:hypothetical protein